MEGKINPLSVKVCDNQFLIKSNTERKYNKIPGHFTTDEYNRLIYIISRTKSDFRKKYGFDKIILEGNWQLDKDHNLIFKIQKSQKLRVKKLKLTGKILQVSGNYLLFEILSRPQEKITTISTIKLKGLWRQDRFNRIVFEVQRKSKPDVLIFRNAWNITRDYYIEYRYKQPPTKQIHGFVLKGSWDITEKNKLVYILAGSSNSLFEFRANLEASTVYSQKGKIKYCIGIGYRKTRVQRYIIFIGEWKRGRKYSLKFELQTTSGQLSGFNFRYEIKKLLPGKVILSLYSRHKTPLGMTLIYTRKFSEDYNYFLEVGSRKIRSGLRCRF